MWIFLLLNHATDKINKWPWKQNHDRHRKHCCTWHFSAVRQWHDKGQGLRVGGGRGGGRTNLLLDAVCWDVSHHCLRACVKQYSTLVVVCKHNGNNDIRGEGTVHAPRHRGGGGGSDTTWCIHRRLYTVHLMLRSVTIDIWRQAANFSHYISWHLMH